MFRNKLSIGKTMLIIAILILLISVFLITTFTKSAENEMINWYFKTSQRTAIGDNRHHDLIVKQKIQQIAFLSTVGFIFLIFGLKTTLDAKCNLEKTNKNNL